MKRTFLTLTQQIAITDYLRKLGQEAIDQLNMSSTDLTEKCAKELSIPLTKSHIKKILVSVGMRVGRRVIDTTDKRLNSGTSASGIAKRLDKVEQALDQICEVLGQSASKLAELDQFIRFAIGEKK